MQHRSEPELASIEKGYMLVDTASRPGMSGAPFIHRNWKQHVMTDGMWLLTAWRGRNL
jgi:hypothetical protein